MSLPIVFRRAARAEYDDAANWYEQLRRGLGVTFTTVVDKVLARIAIQPEYYPAVWDEVREALVPGFPYCVYYRNEPGRVLVLSVFHTSRDPSIWQGRA